MPTQVFLVPDLSCDHCKATIESALSTVVGVDRVAVAMDTKLVTVDGTAPEDAVRAALDAVGYDIVP